MQNKYRRQWFFLHFRQRLVEEYQIIFNGTEDSESTTITDTGFVDRWSWFGVMYRLCNGEIINLEKITELNLLECFTWLSYETDLNLNKQVNLDTHGK